MRCSFLIFFSFCINTLFPQSKTDSLLKNIFANNKNELFQQVLKDPQTYRLQIIYTQINRDKNNKPVFKNYYFNYDPGLYYNPASTVKLPLALLALEKLNTIKIKGIDKNTAVQFDSSYVRQTKLYNDSTSQNALPSIAHFIKKAFLISDNDAYNRLYQFVGQQMINRALYDKGYKNTRIIRQFMGFTADQNRHTNALRFIKEDGSLIYAQPPAYNPDSIFFPQQIKIGKAFYRNDSLINEPIDFTRANNIPLEDLQQMLQSVMFPSSVPVRQRFNLSKSDYALLYQYLSQYSSETDYPKYDANKFFDSYVKFFFKGDKQQMPGHVRVFNKVGWAYGFLTDASYVADFKNKVEFMLAATIYVNSDEVLNDDKYDYDTIGYPFLYQLGQTIYKYELQRPRKYKPDLSAFKLQYEQRNPNDKRPAIKEVDN
ncbi:MAG: serine hydrolase [Chitinophagaceae bacterium]